MVLVNLIRFLFKSKLQMKTQSAKAKGRRLQQQVVSDLLINFEHLSDEDIRSTSMGASGEDIQMSNAARQCIPYSFEAKNQERVNIWQSIQQARSNTPNGTQPVVVFKKNNEQPHVVITWNTFLTLISNKSSEKQEQINRLHRISQDITKIASELSK
jgi:hypothetical protein